MVPIRVLRLDPFTRRSNMMELPVTNATHGRTQLGVTNETAETVLQLSIANSSYRQGMQVKVVDLSVPGYAAFVWGFDKVLRVPGCSITPHNTTEASVFVGPVVLLKMQVPLDHLFSVTRALPVEM
jgi:hypothetical protein